MNMQPKFKKTARRSDLEYPYEYRGYLIKSGSRMMYGLSLIHISEPTRPY